MPWTFPLTNLVLPKYRKRPLSESVCRELEDQLAIAEQNALDALETASTKRFDERAKLLMDILVTADKLADKLVYILQEQRSVMSHYEQLKTEEILGNELTRLEKRKRKRSTIYERDR